MMGLKKDITFIYSDEAELALYASIVTEAQNRGYKVRLTDNKFEKCEIGFYCQHVNFPQYSKFSIIMLHDIVQQYGNWPDIWFREPWDKYDIGILPSKQWLKNWQESSKWYYARPKNGMYLVGWPKADIINKLQQDTSRKKFNETYGLNNDKATVLYAPAWENDGKQDDFVKAMLDLDVNIVIKQAPWNEQLYPEQVANIKEMYELHKNNRRVVILDPKTNIFEAIAVSDILVSEESSTMCEAAMIGTPAISVSDWLIPDTVPSRYPKCDYDFVVMTKKAQLKDCVFDILNNYSKYKEKTEIFAKNNFENIGNTSRIIMDIIDSYVNGVDTKHAAYVKASRGKRLSVQKYIQHRWENFKTEVVHNYSRENLIIRSILWLYRKVKKFLCL